jgi:hypothetical protein
MLCEHEVGPVSIPRAIAAAILSIATVALVVVTLVEEGNDLCHPSGWTQSSWVVVAFLAAGAMFASLRGRLIVKVMAAVVVGALVGGGFWFVLVARWAGACTA